MTTRMRAAVLERTGASLVVGEVALADPGPGQVLVRVAAAGLCHSDLSVIDGTRAKPLPAVAGHEGAGVVAAVGAGVDDLAVGDHVVFVFVSACGRCEFCLSGRPALCARSWANRATGRLADGSTRLDRDGEPLHHWSGISSFAEYAVVARASLVVIPQEIPLLDAAVFGCAVTTGVGSVLNTAHVRPGQTVAVVGLGGVGLSAVMGAVVAGATEIVAVDVQEEKRRLALELGATRAYDPRDDAARQEILGTLGGGVDVAFEMAGVPSALAEAYGLVRRGGTLVLTALPAPQVTIDIPVAAFVSEEKRVLGSYMGSSVPVRDIPRLAALYLRGSLPVDRLRTSTIALDDVNEGFDRLRAGTTVREVIDFGGGA